MKKPILLAQRTSAAPASLSKRAPEKKQAPAERAAVVSNRPKKIEQPVPSLRARMTAALRGENLPKVIGGVAGLLFGAVIALIVLGVVMVYSASSVRAVHVFGDGHHYLVRQAIYAAIGLPLLLFLSRLDYHRYRLLGKPVLALAVCLLLAVILGMGRNAGGASRWIQVGPINIQPAEVTKVALILWLSDSLAKKVEHIRSFSVGFLPHVLMAGFLVVLCMAQPDFGSSVILVLLTFVLMFAAGAKIGYMLAGAAIALPVAFMLVKSSEYRWQRIIAFTDPLKYRMTGGYQIVESWMSFGAGGLTGVGLGDSRQKMLFLPEAHTDFIAAIVAEELGFIGFAVMLGVFLLVVIRGVRAALNAVDEYGTYLAIGLTMFVGIQAVTNLAVVLGLLPTKGLTLPFLSFGGSSLLVNCAAVGILLDISRPRQRPEADETLAPAGGKVSVSREKNRRERPSVLTHEVTAEGGAR